MTSEEKNLLLKDLCARLPYGVICTDNRHGDSRVFNVDAEDENLYYTDFDECGLIENCKPYLRPMSSMTEEEKKEWVDLFNKPLIELDEYSDKNAEEIAPQMFAMSHTSSINWLLKNHFDFMGLIPKGLALEAPNGMYN